MNCTQARHAIQLDLDGELMPLQKRALRRHLAGCDACRAVMQQHTVIRSAMGRLAEQCPTEQCLPEPSRDREGAEPKTIKCPAAPDRRRRWPHFAAVAAALALCIGGWRFTVELRRAHETSIVQVLPTAEPPIAPPAPRPVVRVEFDRPLDVIAIPKPTRNPNITVLWIYPTVKTAEANLPPAIEPDSLESQGAHS